MTEESAENVRRDLQRLQPIVEQIVGVSSRWNGTVDIVDTSEFNGKKPFSCHILLSSRLTYSDLRWRTLIHELFHSVSAGYNSSDYKEYLGWEEGVVEMMQRLHRQEMLARLNVSIDEATSTQWEANFAFNRFINAFVMGLSQSLPPSERLLFVTIFSAANSVLTTRGVR